MAQKGAKPRKCGTWLTRDPNSNKSLSRHLERCHHHKYNLFQQASKRSKVTKSAKAAAVAGDRSQPKIMASVAGTVMSDVARHAQNRRLVIEMAMDLRPAWRRHCMGYQLHVGGLQPSYATTQTHEETMHNVLLELVLEVKDSIVGILEAQRNRRVELKYYGPSAASSWISPQLERWNIARRLSPLHFGTLQTSCASAWRSHPSVARNPVLTSSFGFRR